jgi:hypothetical protein
MSRRPTTPDVSIAPIGLEIRYPGTLDEESIITLALDGVPEFDSLLAKDITDAYKIAVAMATDYQRKLGYKKITNVCFDGEKWLAEFEIEFELSESEVAGNATVE